MQTRRYEIIVYLTSLAPQGQQATTRTAEKRRKAARTRREFKPEMGQTQEDLEGQPAEARVGTEMSAPKRRSLQMFLCLRC